MSLSSFAYSLSLFWLIVHALHRLFLHRKLNQGSILPSNTRRRENRLTRTRDWDVDVTIKFLQMKVETMGWNEVHDRLLVRLKRKGGMGRVWVERFYDLGLGVGMIGMGAALVLLVWTSWSLMKPFLILVGGAYRGRVKGGAGRLVKRELGVDVGSAYTEGVDSPITPIIPGLTVPLSHIPIILIALFVSQIIHELGHAIAGALYGIPIVSSGASFVICIPAAFVAFTKEGIENLGSRRKARVVAAGPWHNLVGWCFWMGVGWVVGNGGVGGVFLRVVGYRDVSDVGRVVLGVDEASPLAGYLMPGTIVTKLNDYSMITEVDRDPWSSFLSSSKNDEMALGWCVGSAELGASPKECCLPGESTLTSLSCFTANTTPIQLGCLNPVPILTTTDKKARCASEEGCKDGFVCVRPAEKENLLRLTVRSGDELEHEEVVLWTGPREEIYDEVTVGIWLPRFFFLPLSMPSWVRSFWEYMLIVNLSLFLFNLVPISGLDGSHLLRAILGTFRERDVSEVHDIEALERDDTRDSPRNRRRFRDGFLERAISGGATVLVGLDVALLVFGLIRT